MSTPGQRAVAALLEAGALLTPGLTPAELANLEEKWGIQFTGDHADFLQRAVPLGEGWVDWRGADEPIAQRLRLPVDGLLYDVDNNAFWPASWGERPADAQAAHDVAAVQLGTWPRLIPVFGHRYLPPGPVDSPVPVLSVVQSDVIYYGFDLHEWVQREFFGLSLPAAGGARPEIPFWSRLADSEDDEL